MDEFPKQDLVDPSSLIRVEPFAYQSVGYNWLRALREIEVGGILGDEMGLGKTLQAIMLFESEIRNKRTPNLVVCPPSLTENWRREIAKFIGRLAYTHQGADRLFDVELLKKREYDDIIIIDDCRLMGKKGSCGMGEDHPIYPTMEFDWSHITDDVITAMMKDGYVLLKNDDCQYTDGPYDQYILVKSQPSTR
jgi:hypothetical protein